MSYYNILNKIIGAIFFISGTSIGAGMLGLPIRTIGLDIYFVLFLFLIVWVIMIFSAIAMLEISLWVPGESNVISISNFVFGKSFSFIVGMIYVAFLYSLIAAYISGGISMITDLFSLNYSSYFFNFLFVFPFFLMIIFGFNASDYMNRFFFILLVFLYVILTFNLIVTLDFAINNFNFFEKNLGIFSLPIILTSFGYSLLIPSLKTYLFNNSKIIIFVIFLGSFIPFLVYIFWQYFIYTFLFNISNNLFMQTLFGYGNPAEKLMILIGNNNVLILYVISLFSLAALVSSLIGVSLSLYDFFSDLLKLSKKSYFDKVFCLLFVFLPPVFLTIFFKNSFMFFLSYAGAIAAFLLVIFPVYTLWYGRYIRKFNYNYVFFYNRYILFFIFLFGFLVFFVDLFYKYFI